MNDFHRDDAFQQELRDSVLVPQLYRRHFWWRYRLMDGNKEFQNRGIDTVIQGKGEPILIEEKIVRWPGYKYDAFALETISCSIPGLEKLGWMSYGKADRLLYCFDTDDDYLDCWWIDFPALQAWFWPLQSTFAPFEMTTRNRTCGRVVPIDDVTANIATENFQLHKPR